MSWNADLVRVASDDCVERSNAFLMDVLAAAAKHGISLDGDGGGVVMLKDLRRVKPDLEWPFVAHLEAGGPGGLTIWFTAFKAADFPKSAKRIKDEHLAAESL